MHEYDREQFDVDCPSEKCRGRRAFPVAYSQVLQHHKARCPRCGTELEFHSQALMELRRAVERVEQGLRQLAKARDQLMREVTVKSRF